MDRKNLTPPPPAPPSALKSQIRNIAFIFVIVVALGAIGFAAYKMIGKSAPAYSAIEQAAVAAADSLSTIVVDSPEFGFVALSDLSAEGVATQAKDGYSLPVRGINSLIGTARLDMIIADKLTEPLMVDFAKQDLKNALSAKDLLIEALTKSIEKDGAATDRNGKPVKPYAAAEAAYQKANTGTYEAGSLRLTLGSLQGGGATAVAVPNPASADSLTDKMVVDGTYRSYTNIPYKGVDFVFGGIGRSVTVVEAQKWKDAIESLPYQIPTVIKAEVGTAIACAQPASRDEYPPTPGALTISFPDGAVPEIRRPADLCENQKLNSTLTGAMDLLTASGGDYPTDGGTSMKAMNWPLTGKASTEPVGNVWRLALYDWLRRAGPRANVDSVVGMQKVSLDAPKPPTKPWITPVDSSGTMQKVGSVASGIIHIFEFNRDGAVTYRSKLLTPYPLSVVGENQLYGEGYGALMDSKVGVQRVKLSISPEKDVTFRAAWDVYIRDQVRNLGISHGGKHAGEPIAKPALARLNFESTNVSIPVADTDTSADGQPAEVSPKSKTKEAPAPQGNNDVTSGDAPTLAPTTQADDSADRSIENIRGHGKGKGKGAVGISGRDEAGSPPLIAPQSDFGEAMSPPAPFVPAMPDGAGSRPFYGTSGTAVDITFRRQIDVSDLNGFFSTGYLGTVGNENAPASTKAD